MIDFFLHLHACSLCTSHFNCSCSLAEVFLGSISDVLQPALGLDCAEFDPELQKLQLHVRGVYIARQWFSHDFSMSVQECRDAMSSLSELCSLNSFWKHS